MEQRNAQVDAQRARTVIGGRMQRADRQRVMPHSWFILARLFVRVDNVLFRMYDVRLFHSFGSGEVVREISGMEADYEHVKAVSCLFYPVYLCGGGAYPRCGTQRIKSS